MKNFISKKICRMKNRIKNYKLKKSTFDKIYRAVSIFVTALFILSTFVLPAFAASSTGVEASLNKIVDLVVVVVRIIGFVLSVWGIVEFAMAQNAHDGAGKLRGVSLLASGILVFFAKEILSYAGVSL